MAAPRLPPATSGQGCSPTPHHCQGRGLDCSTPLLLWAGATPCLPAAVLGQDCSTLPFWARAGATRSHDRGGGSGHSGGGCSNGHSHGGGCSRVQPPVNALPSLPPLLPDASPSLLALCCGGSLSGPWLRGRGSGPSPCCYGGAPPCGAG